MNPRTLTPHLSVSDQIDPQDIGALAAHGFRGIIGNRPDGEAHDQPDWSAVAAAAAAAGIEARFIPVTGGAIDDHAITEFADALREMEGPVLAYCRTGTRSTTLWALSEAGHLSSDAIVATASGAGYQLDTLRPRIEARARGIRPLAGQGVAALPVPQRHDVVIIGGGAGGISVAASLLKRRPGLDIVIVEPRDTHYYQPGWTLVGGGVFDRRQTQRPMASVMPKGVRWVKAAASRFAPDRNEVVLEDGGRIAYKILVVAPGNRLDWDGIAGLRETLGKHGVTSNYLFDMAPYTWELVQGLREGRAIFTQPPMPIKCAGAPQKAMYLACSHWERQGRLPKIDVAFHNAGGVLFGVADYVPALMDTVDRYGIGLNFGSTLVAVDGPARQATFRTEAGEVTQDFDMLHVCPPQKAPDIVADSPLADASGYTDLDQQTMRHKRYGNIFGLGDAGSTPNAKTAAAVRKQAPVVAVNALAVLDGAQPRAVYDGYGSCPLTVERGKIVLAEFAYGGKLAPSFPKWLCDGTKPTRLAWFLKEKMLPPIYWDAMLKGHEWLAGPQLLPHAPTPHDSAANPCGAEAPRKRA